MSPPKMNLALLRTLAQNHAEEVTGLEKGLLNNLEPYSV